MSEQSEKDAAVAPQLGSALFERVAIFNISPDGKEEPVLAHAIPESLSAEDEKVPLSRMSIFCFPFRDPKIIPVDRQTFTFGLTLGNGDPLFGFCLKDQPATPASASVLICIVSELPWHSFFFKLLGYISDVYKHGREKEGFERIEEALLKLRHLRGILLRSPLGQEIKLTIGDSRPHALTTPNCTKVPLFSQTELVEALVNTLSPKNILEVLSSLLAERRVLLFSESMSKLSSCFYCFSHLLFPFVWQHVFIPALPASLIDYCCTPLPFFIGAHASLRPSIQSLPLEQLLVVDLDQDGLRTPFNDINILPVAFVTDVSIAAKAVRNKKKPPSYFIDRTLNLFIELFSGYPNFIRQQKRANSATDADAGTDAPRALETRRDGRHGTRQTTQAARDASARRPAPVFDVDRFVLHKPRFNVLLRMLCSTQQFTQFLHADDAPAEIRFGSVADNRELFDEYIHAAVTKATYKANRKSRAEKAFHVMKKKTMKMRGKGKLPSSLAATHSMMERSLSSSSSTASPSALKELPFEQPASARTFDGSTPSSHPSVPPKIAPYVAPASSNEVTLRNKRAGKTQASIERPLTISLPLPPEEITRIRATESTISSSKEKTGKEQKSQQRPASTPRRTTSDAAPPERLSRFFRLHNLAKQNLSVEINTILSSTAKESGAKKTTVGTSVVVKPPAPVSKPAPPARSGSTEELDAQESCLPHSSPSYSRNNPFDPASPLVARRRTHNLKAVDAAMRARHRNAEAFPQGQHVTLAPSTLKASPPAIPARPTLRGSARDASPAQRSGNETASLSPNYINNPFLSPSTLIGGSEGPNRHSAQLGDGVEVDTKRSGSTLVRSRSSEALRIFSHPFAGTHDGDATEGGEDAPLQSRDVITSTDDDESSNRGVGERSNSSSSGMAGGRFNQHSDGSVAGENEWVPTPPVRQRNSTLSASFHGPKPSVKMMMHMSDGTNTHRVEDTPESPSQEQQQPRTKSRRRKFTASDSHE